MPKFVIERDIPGASLLTEAEIREASLKSLEILRKLGPGIKWIHSYVTDDKIYCVYIAPSAKEVLEHAQQGGFPANVVAQVLRVIDPTTAE